MHSPSGQRVKSQILTIILGLDHILSFLHICFFVHIYLGEIWTVGFEIHKRTDKQTNQQTGIQTDRHTDTLITILRTLTGGVRASEGR